MPINASPSTDMFQAYQQVWPEVSRPAAGATFPEWITYRFVPTVSGFIPSHELIALQALNRSSSY